MCDLQIECLVRSLGIGATYRGYRYLNYGIKLCIYDENYLLGINKHLYPQIAREYNATCSSVERDIRTVVKVCWDRGNRPYLQEIALYPLQFKPTSGEFFDILVGHLNRTVYAKNEV